MVSPPRSCRPLFQGSPSALLQLFSERNRHTEKRTHSAEHTWYPEPHRERERSRLFPGSAQERPDPHSTVGWSAGELLLVESQWAASFIQLYVYEIRPIFIFNCW